MSGTSVSTSVSVGIAGVAVTIAVSFTETSPSGSPSTGSSVDVMVVATGVIGTTSETVGVGIISPGVPVCEEVDRRSCCGSDCRMQGGDIVCNGGWEYDCGDCGASATDDEAWDAERRNGYDIADDAEGVLDPNMGFCGEMRRRGCTVRSDSQSSFEAVGACCPGCCCAGTGTSCTACAAGGDSGCCGGGSEGDSGRCVLGEEYVALRVDGDTHKRDGDMGLSVGDNGRRVGDIGLRVETPVMTPVANEAEGVDMRSAKPPRGRLAFLVRRAPFIAMAT